MNLSPLPNVAGISLDGADPFVISAEDNRVLCATTNVTPDPDGRAHPSYYFIATQAGMGRTVSGLCEICEFDIADGPMIVNTKVEFSKPLMTGQPYFVRGEIIGLTRKTSRRIGVMDVLEYRLRLVLPDEEAVLVTTNSWVLPRKNSA